MSKQVWRCDYCSGTEDDEAIIAVHENTCQFNPMVKTCGSCKNEEQIPYERHWHCSLGVEIKDEHQEQEPFANCIKWVGK